MVKACGFLITLLISIGAHAEGLDLDAGFAGRSLPFGAGGWGTVGYGKLLWGEEGENPLAYGYFRPSLEISSSYFVNKGTLAFDVFPIGIFGLSAGHVWSSRSLNEMETLDCSVVRCNGSWSGSFAKGTLALGYEKFFALYTRKLTFIVSGDPSRPIAEEFSVLVGRSDRDRLCDSDLIVGYAISEQWSAGIQYKVQSMLDSGNANEMITGYGRWESGAYAITGAAGQHVSPTQPRSFTVQALFEWKIKKRMGIL